MDNTTLPTGGGGDTIRTLDKTGTGAPKTEVVALDLGGGDGRSEAIASFPLPVKLDDVPVDDDGTPIYSFSGATLDAIEMLFRQLIAAASAPYPQSLAEIKAQAVPVNLTIQWGDPNRFVQSGYTWGVNVTTDTTALTTWASVGGMLTGPANVSALINAQIPLVSNTTLNASKGFTINTASNISIFYANVKSNITIRGVSFVQTNGGRTPYVAHVRLDTCTDCLVENCTSSGMNWSGVMLNNSNRCTVRGNYFTGLTGLTANISAITIAGSAVITVTTISAANPFAVNDSVQVSGVLGMTQINGLSGLVTAIGGVSGAWTATVNINSSAFSVYTGGGILMMMVQDSNDIVLYQSCSYNIIDGNICNGGTDHGIFMQDPYNTPGTPPTRNMVTNNRVGGPGHQAYGIVLYCPAQSSTGSLNFVGAGTIVGGSGYTNGQYNSVALTGGTGSGATAHITVSGGAVTAVQPAALGTGFVLGDVLSAAAANIGGTGSGFTLTLLAVNTPATTMNQIIGNQIENVTGTAPYVTSSGMGIYIVGSGGGGTQVIGNSVRNCCINTVAGRALPPGGIAVAVGGSGVAPVVVANNTITDMLQYEGIDISGSIVGMTVANNTIVVPAANTTGAAIRVENSDNISLTGNNVLQNGSGQGILLYASSDYVNNTVVNGNVISTAVGNPLTTTFGLAGLTLNSINVSDNLFLTTSNSPNGMALAGALGAQIENNYVSVGIQSAYVQSSCTKVRIANNTFLTNGNFPTVTFTGTNTDSYYDKTNYGPTVIGGGGGRDFTNAGTGLIIETLGNAAPTQGTWAVADRVEQSVPAMGSPTGWRCTVAGSPGTWVAEAYLDHVSPYAYGSFTIPTGNFLALSKRLQLTGTQRGAAAGTARLRIN